MTKNPFKPSYGATPHIVIGRGRFLDTFKKSIANGSNAKGSSTLLSGDRGMGKTVLLNEAEDYAQSQGFFVISLTARGNRVLYEIERQVDRYLAEYTDSGPKKSKKVTGVNASIAGTGGGITWENKDSEHTSFEDKLDQILAWADSKESGLLISIDEAQALSAEELPVLTSAIQRMNRNNRNLKLILAGLPSGIKRIITQDASSFISRSDRKNLDYLSIADIIDAYETSFNSSDQPVRFNHFKRLAEASEGYPYMVQLLGYNFWEQLEDHPEKSLEDMVEVAIEESREERDSQAWSLQYQELAPKEKEIVRAMSHMGDYAEVSAIRNELDMKPGTFGVLRSRLIKKNVLKAEAHGLLAFRVDSFRDYVSALSSNNLD